jgi:methionine-rich copper-binding protein CopC
MDVPSGQFGIPAQAPVNRTSGSQVRLLVQTHVFFENLAPSTLGKPPFQYAEDSPMRAFQRPIYIAATVLKQTLWAFGLAACLAVPALAHVHPQQQTPAAGATLASPPAVSITFDGTLEPAFSTLTVTDSSGKAVQTGKAHVDDARPKVLSVPLPALAPGRYTVHWSAVAPDGHRTHGDYTFSVK